MGHMKEGMAIKTNFDIKKTTYICVIEYKKSHLIRST